MNVQGQRSEYIFVRNGGDSVNYPSNVYPNASGFGNWEISHGYFAV